MPAESIDAEDATSSVWLRRRLDSRAIGMLTVTACSLAVLTCLVLFVVSGTPADYLTYRYGAVAANHGVDVYLHDVDAPQFGIAQPFTYTPFGACVLTLTTWPGWRASYLLWCLGSMLVLGAVLARFVPRRSRRRPLVLVLLIVAASSTCIVTHNIEQGQINLFLMGACLADVFRRDDRVLGIPLPRGVLVGIAAAIKLTPALFIVYFALTRQRRLTRNAALSALGATIVAAAIHPAMTLTFLRSALWSLTDRVDTRDDPGNYGNNSLTGALHAIGGWTATLTIPVVLAAALGGLLAARQVHRCRNEVDAWLIVGLTAPLISPWSWIHHLVYILPALARLVLGTTRERAVARGSRIGLGLAAVFMLALGPDVGHRWLALHNAWLLFPGVVLRESAVLISVACIVSLYRDRAAFFEDVRSLPG